MNLKAEKLIRTFFITKASLLCIVTNFIQEFISIYFSFFFFFSKRFFNWKEGKKEGKKEDNHNNWQIGGPTLLGYQELKLSGLLWLTNFGVLQILYLLFHWRWREHLLPNLSRFIFYILFYFIFFSLLVWKNFIAIKKNQKGREAWTFLKDFH